MTYSEGELLADIRAVADAVDRTPSLADYREHGSYAASTITRRFESWQAAVRAAGFEPHAATTAVPTDDLLAELDRLGAAHDQPPTVELMNSEGKYWASTYKNQFGSWSAALEAAGFDPADGRTRVEIPDADLIAELQRVADECGVPPSFQAMSEVGTYSPRTYVDRFGSWNKAVKAAGFEPRK